jgi:selenium metabolism protein YedF
VAINKDLLVVIKSSGLGEGEPDLGEKLMKAFLNVLLESGDLPDRIIFMNSGIFLTTKGSSVTDILQKYADQGVSISSCGTCLDYYDRKDKLVIGESGNMKDAVAAMLSHKKVLAP